LRMTMSYGVAATARKMGSKASIRVIILARDGAIVNRPMSDFASTAYITSTGKFLPGDPIDNDSMEEYLGIVGERKSSVGEKIIKENGIERRHYAIDREQKTLFSNSEMAARAVRDALERSSIDVADVDFLAAATSQGDFPLPGFASMVHAELGIPPCEIATLH